MVDMIRLAFSFLLGLILCLACSPSSWTGRSGPGGPQQKQQIKVLTLEDNRSEIEIKQGDLFQVELESPGATGYLWQVEDLDSTRLDLVHQTTRALLSDGRVGGPILSVFTFRTVSQGSATLTIDYYRPWEGRAKSEKTFSVKVNIL